MSGINIVVSGLPGKMATLAAEILLRYGGFGSKIVALTGPNQPKNVSVCGLQFMLFSPEQHENYLIALKEGHYNPLVVDFSKGAVNRNAELYCRHGIPFVMGTTGGDRKALEQVVVDSGNVAVIAPNMALPIVALQQFIEDFSGRHTGAMKGYKLKVVESHQAGKKDTSGTAKAMISYFNRLGIEFTPEQVEMIRDPARQREMGIPEEHLGGHGWHTYEITAPDTSNLKGMYCLQDEFSRFLREHPVFRGYKKTDMPPRYDATSKDGNVKIVFGGLTLTGASDVFIQHNINGRQVYADGTLDAVKFLAKHLEEKGRVYTMIDVLNNLN